MEKPGRRKMPAGEADASTFKFQIVKGTRVEYVGCVRLMEKSRRRAPRDATVAQSGVAHEGTRRGSSGENVQALRANAEE